MVLVLNLVQEPEMYSVDAESGTTLVSTSIQASIAQD